MRWLLGRGAGACPACGAELERGAAWCGACGARTGADGDAELAAAPEAMAVASQLRSPAPEPLLGHLGESTGMSATGPPPSGLRRNARSSTAGSCS